MSLEPDRIKHRTRLPALSLFSISSCAAAGQGLELSHAVTNGGYVASSTPLCFSPSRRGNRSCPAGIRRSVSGSLNAWPGAGSPSEDQYSTRCCSTYETKGVHK